MLIKVALNVEKLFFFSVKNEEAQDPVWITQLYTFFILYQEHWSQLFFFCSAQDHTFVHLGIALCTAYNTHYS